MSKKMGCVVTLALILTSCDVGYQAANTGVKESEKTIVLDSQTPEHILFDRPEGPLLGLNSSFIPPGCISLRDRGGAC